MKSNTFWLHTVDCFVIVKYMCVRSPVSDYQQCVTSSAEFHYRSKRKLESCASLCHELCNRAHVQSLRSDPFVAHGCRQLGDH
jgi:hypothetical protein